MGLNGQHFVLAIIFMSTVGWVITTWIRAKHGYPVEGEWGGSIHKVDPVTKQLTAENEQLKTTVARLEDRLKVLERIATDPSRQLADDINNLR